MPRQLTKALMVALALVPCGGAAAKAVDLEKMAKAFTEQFDVWINKHDKVIEQGAIAVIAGGKVVAQARFGNTDAMMPEPVASLSKSVTGLCIVRLVEAGKLRYSDRVGVLLNGYFNRLGEPPADKRLAQVTVAQLLTHTSGIQEVRIPDKPPLREQFVATLRKPLAARPGSSHHYENANFQVLGLIIEEITGESYARLCSRLVLEPVGIRNARLSTVYPYMASWGGWVLSAHDVARLLRYFDPRLALTKTSFADWPKHDLGNRWFYSIGISLRHNEDGSYSAVHNGVWTWHHARTGIDQFAARMVMFGTGIGFAVVMRRSPDGLGQDLEHEIWKASLPFGKPDLQ